MKERNLYMKNKLTVNLSEKYVILNDSITNFSRYYGKVFNRKIEDCALSQGHISRALSPDTFHYVYLTLK